MGKIYIDQPLEVELDTLVDISDALDLSIDYLDPAGNSGSWSPVSVVASTKVSYTVPSGVLTSGTWRTQAMVTTVDGVTPGETVQFKVYELFL